MNMLNVEDTILFLIHLSKDAIIQNTIDWSISVSMDFTKDTFIQRNIKEKYLSDATYAPYAGLPYRSFLTFVYLGLLTHLIIFLNIYTNHFIEKAPFRF